MKVWCETCKGRKNVWDCTSADERQTKLEKCSDCKGSGFKELNEPVNKVPYQCYKDFGSDLDGCSTQQNEGCGRCNIFINGVGMV